MRKQITLNLPKDLIDSVDLLSKRNLGVGRNAFFVLGGALLLVKLGHLLPQTKRSVLINYLDTEISAIMEKARKTA